jgi:hypothetical protein
VLLALTAYGFDFAVPSVLYLRGILPDPMTKSQNQTTRSRATAILHDGHFWIPVCVLVGGLILLSRII